jgi:sulfur-oxidizing protein SoxY
MNRRSLLKASLASLLAALGAAFTGPRSARAAWAAEPFEAKTVSEALKRAFGSDQFVSTDAITLKAPNLAENGAMVPLEVSTTLPNLDSLGFLVEGNQAPLTALFSLSPDANRTLATRVKMAKSSAVIVVGRAGGKLYGARKEIKVTIGGCGG